MESTGWTCIRPNDEWEFFFKSGIPCPKHLGAHAHSDLLSFELYKKGKPIFISAGTSVYENCAQRNFERSGQSHNIMQLGLRKGFGYPRIVNWIEELMFGIHLGREKSKVIGRSYGLTREGVFYVEGVYDTYKSINANTREELKLVLIQIKTNLLLMISLNVNTV